MMHADDSKLLCDNFYKHETVLQNGSEACFPIRLFVDGAKLDEGATTLNIRMHVCIARRAPQHPDTQSMLCFRS